MGFMLEDVILQQKLEAEIAEGHEEVELDLTPNLGGTQTLSLSGGPDGHWKSEGVGDTVPLPGGGDQGDLPPPPPPSRSFRQRFLADQPNTEMAVKELQKLKWTLNRRRVTNTNSPFPCLSLACSRLISLMVS